MSASESNNGRVVTWPQLGVLAFIASMILGSMVGGGATWINQLDNAQADALRRLNKQADRNRERINEDLRSLQALDNRIDRLEDEQTVDPRDLSAIIANLERRLDALDEKTDRVLQRLGEGLPGQTRRAP